MNIDFEFFISFRLILIDVITFEFNLDACFHGRFVKYEAHDALKHNCS